MKKRKIIVLISVAFALLASVGCPRKQTTRDEQTIPPKEVKEQPTPEPEQPKEVKEVKKVEPEAKPAPIPEKHPALLNPALANESAPETFKVKFTTTKGDIVIELNRSWSPNGVDRFYNLVKIGFYTDIAFFRVIKGFMAQFGISGDPLVSAKWREANISDDPVQESNTRGKVSFATAGPNTRTTQLFINYGNNSNLDRMGFSPIGEVVEGMDVVDSLYMEYGEGAPRDKGPDQGYIQQRGNTYLKEQFPNLDYIKKAAIME